MRFKIDVNMLEGKLSVERESSADALEVAKTGDLGVTITDTTDSKTYGLQDFEARFLRKH